MSSIPLNSLLNSLLPVIFRQSMKQRYTDPEKLKMAEDLGYSYAYQFPNYTLDNCQGFAAIIEQCRKEVFGENRPDPANILKWREFVDKALSRLPSEMVDTVC